MGKQSIVMNEKIDITDNNQPLDEYEFDIYYSIVLEDLSRSIKKHLGIEFTDHPLYRLCENLEKELKRGENCYE